MSDCFERLVDVDVSLAEAPALCKEVTARLRELGLITGRLNKRCVLGGSGYLPGEAIAEAYRRAKGEYNFYELSTCGVEPIVGRHFNFWALGEACEGFTCPACAAGIDAFDEGFSEALGNGLTKWDEQSGKPLVACPECKKKLDVTKWQCRPPLGFGNLSFSFWNWPPFDSPAWQINIPEVLREATGHTIIQTFGHI